MNQTTDAAYIRQMLKACLEIPSPCGDTEEISQFLKKELESMEIETRVTNKGAIIGILPGEKEGFSRMVSAHVDTLGAMVKRIKDNGRLRLENVGGYSWTSVEGENVRVKTREGKIFTGTLMPERASVHCFPEDAREEERTAEEKAAAYADHSVDSACSCLSDSGRDTAVSADKFCCVSVETRAGSF